MDLIPGACFRLDQSISNTVGAGVYRVIFDDPSADVTIAVQIIADDKNQTPRGGRKRKCETDLKRKRKKAPPPLVGELKWLRHSELVGLSGERLARPFEISRSVPPKLSKRGQALFERRKKTMAPFLDLTLLQQSIVRHDSVHVLVDFVVKTHHVSRAFVYRQWSNLCRWGFEEDSLSPRHDLCGAPGVTRPCDPGGRKKAGRKTTEQRIARHYGHHLPPIQPGLSTEWAAAIQAADRRIPSPKPRWPRRCELIVASAFCGKAEEVDGRLSYARPDEGSYPNDRQIQRVLTEGKTQLERIIERTTKRHFQAAQRGLIGRNWTDLAGPGVRWAIDSTIGDIYLRSSVNRAWIVGRPVVYIIVDVWSTAVVGFYVCLTGPSWATACVSIFNAATAPALTGEIWGYEPVLSLSPLPTICHTLECDRGEYLSQGHRKTAFKLIPHTTYTPPYRGDLKGLVEVLHRITKDQQFLFLPGAMDYRREELELKRIDPATCTMTVTDYVQYLHQVFARYNLTADRRHRIDAFMEADGVHPSPAGLWNWGHLVGIGYRKFTPEATLIGKFLPKSTGRVRRDGIRHAGCDYTCPETEREQWTAIARNCCGWDIPVHYYPGPMRSIWTPSSDQSSLLKLTIRDETGAAADTTHDEWADCVALKTVRWPREKHENLMSSIETLARIQTIEREARRKTEEAIARAKGATPTMTEARLIEVAATTHPSESEAKTAEAIRDEALDAHQSMLDQLLKSANHDE